MNYIKMNSDGLFSNRAICSLLKKLSAKEVEDFAGYLRFRGRKRNSELWTVLKKYYPHFEVEDKSIYKKIVKDKKYSDTTFRSWVSSLYGLAKNYIGLIEFEGNAHLQHNAIQLGLLRRDDEQGYRSARRDAEKFYRDNPIKSVEEIRCRQEMEDYLYQYSNLYAHYKHTPSLQNTANLASQCYLSSMLMYFTLMKNRERITGEQYKYPLEQEIVNHLHGQDYPQFPIIKLYSLLFQLQKDRQNEPLFEKFVANYKKNKQGLHDIDARHLIYAVSNIAHWNIQEGHLNYLKTRFSLTKLLLEDGLALVENRLTPQHYQYIMTVAIQAGEVEWATVFHQDNLVLVDEKERPALMTMMCAYLYFSRSEYDKQADYMHKMETNDYVMDNLQMKIFHRILCAKTAYMRLGNQPTKYQTLAYQNTLEKLRHFINRQQEEASNSDPRIAQNLKKACDNFRKALQLIYNQKYGLRKKKIDLKKEILSMQQIRELPWLLSILD